MACFAANGTLEGLTEVPLSSTTVSRRCVTVSPTGEMFFLKTMKRAVDGVGIGFRATPDGKFIEPPRRFNPGLYAWTEAGGRSSPILVL